MAEQTKVVGAISPSRNASWSNCGKSFKFKGYLPRKAHGGRNLGRQTGVSEPSGTKDIDCEYFLILLNMVSVSLKQAPLELFSKYIEAFEFVPGWLSFRRRLTQAMLFLP